MIITNEAELRLPCTDASENEVGAIVEQLERELEYSGRMARPGIGLSAIQIGIHKNVAIVRVDNNHSVNLVNCKIQNKYDEFKFLQEGCLSFPNLVGDTIRYNEVHIVDNLVYPHAMILTGIMAVVAEHEIDHWNNRLLPDFILKEEKIIAKARPNDICPCGIVDPSTGKVKKYKKCHGKG
jgi:peptide deformylase